MFSEWTLADVLVPSLVAEEFLGDLQVRIRWRQTPLSGAFRAYILSRSETGEIVKETTLRSDTSAVVRGSDTFGEPVRYSLKISGVVPGTSVGRGVFVYADPASPFAAGGPFGNQPTAPKWPRVVSVPSRGAVLGLNAESLQPVLHDAETLQALATASLPESAAVPALVASPSGRIALLRPDGTAYELDPTTLEVVRTVDVSGWVSRPGTEWGRVGLSDDGVLFFGPGGGGASTTPASLVAVDLDTGTRVGYVPPDPDAQGLRGGAPVRLGRS